MAPPFLFPWVQQQQQGGKLLSQAGPGTSQYPGYKVYVDWDSDGSTFSTGGTSTLLKDLTPSDALPPELAPTRGYGVKSARIRRGRDDALTLMRAGEATLTLHDPTGFYNPENASSPLAGLLLPMKPVLIAASNGSTVETTAFGWPLFFGFIRSIEHDPDRAVQESRIECVGRLLRLQRYIPNRTVTASPEYTVGRALINSILNAGSPPIYPQDDQIDETEGITVPTTWRAVESNALEAAEALLLADRGCFFELAGGGMAYEPRAARTAKASVATITDTMQGLRPGVDLDRVGNRVKVTRTGGEAQEANNATSQTAYGVVDIGDIESPYLENDAAALTLAEYLVDQFGSPRSPMYRLDLMNRDITTTDQILQRELQDRITVVDALSGTSGDYFIEAIEHEITDGGKYHRCSWILSALGEGTATGHAGSINTSSATPGPPQITYLESGSAFPTDPPDRAEVYYVADATNGIVWQFRFRRASGSSYQWEFVGGPPLRAENAGTSMTTTSTSYVDLSTVGPTITVPLAGDYLVQAWCQAQHNTAAALGTMALKIGAAATSDSNAVRGQAPAANYDITMPTYSQIITASAASTVLKMQYKTNTGTLTVNNAGLIKPWMTVTPVRVTG